MLTHVPPSQLSAVWSWVRAGLEEAQHEHSWIPEDAYYALRANPLYVRLYTFGHDDGFVIVQKLTGDDFRGLLHVWCICGPVEHAQAVLAALDDLARKEGLSRVRAVAPATWPWRDGFKVRGLAFERGLGEASMQDQQNGDCTDVRT